MIFRITVIIFYVLFFCLGLFRNEYTDDEKTYLQYLSFNSENIHEFFFDPCGANPPF